MKRRKPHGYELPDGSGFLTSSELRRADRDTQLDVMRHWFYANYEDPVENTPYESAEGGYIYIWGGPYDPQEELDSEFGGHISDKVIAELADELRNISWEWTGHTDNQIDDYFIDSIAEFSEHLEAFKESIFN